jgi:hypothetical protein
VFRHRTGLVPNNTNLATRPPYIAGYQIHVPRKVRDFKALVYVRES